MKNKTAGKPLEVKCPTCKRMAKYEGNEFRPFCSQRCRLLDLGAWAKEEFKVACVDDDQDGSADETEEDEE